MHAIHQPTGTMFFAEINRSAVTCWSRDTKLRPSSMGEVARDNVTLIYPSDLDVRAGRERKEVRNKKSFLSLGLGGWR